MLKIGLTVLNYFYNMLRGDVVHLKSRLQSETSGMQNYWSFRHHSVFPQPILFIKLRKVGY